MSFVCALPEFVDAVAAESGRGCSTISQENAAACCPDDVDRGRWGR
ncbi:PE family protein [Mycobacterium kansasii]|nr:PE family protein [Mycobacterium kansasii]